MEITGFFLSSTLWPRATFGMQVSLMDLNKTYSNYNPRVKIGLAIVPSIVETSKILSFAILPPAAKLAM